MATIVRDLRTARAILKQIVKENNIDSENVSVNKDFKYIETVDSWKKDADFCTTVYKGAKFSVQYVSGCFNPFIVAIEG